LINISHEYNVVINPYSSHHSIMKLIILQNDCNGQVLPISEGIAKTRANLNLARIISRQHDTREPGGHHEYASADTPWVAHALSQCTPVRYGRIASVSATHDTTQFRDSICHGCVRTFQMLVHSDPTDTGLNRHRQRLLP
jgi:hypothetical protein